MNESVFDRIETVKGDITKSRVDAIVNAANSRLVPGGGVDGAIHRAAGPELARFCLTLDGCPPGEAKIAPGFGLPAEFVILTAGPVYRGGKSGEPELLASCYRRSLETAEEHGCRRVAFPAISTGVFGYPFEAASRIAIRTVASFLETHDTPRTVRFVLFGPSDLAAFREVLAKIEAERA
ncbi:MAG: O-acetyl-ADP-ribose deacetylase [Candidatus Eisenbacteria bacterium]